MPAVFLGHGNPMNALEKNRFSETWSNLGKSLPKPKAILSVSAHWMIDRTAVTAMQNPKIIHDFSGFPDELYRVQYPVKGDVELAEKVQVLLNPVSVESDMDWGIDHGTWSVLVHVFPEADVPVVQLSIDGTKSPQFHYEMGRHLAPLRDEGVLILGSGNVVHNLRAYQWKMMSASAFDWNKRFETWVKENFPADKHSALIDYQRHPDAGMAVPPPADHYLPMLYVLGSGANDREFTVLVDGAEGASISMLSVRVG